MSKAHIGRFRIRRFRVGKVGPEFISGVMVTLFSAVALCLRIFLPYDRVFGSDWIKFTSADAYYHMRLIDNLVHNFPHLMDFDPYLLYPGGANVYGTFFQRLLASIIWLIGLGSPTQHTIDVVSVYFPAILGALTVIPVYFIGKELFGRWAGVLSAGLIAIMPGEFMGRSILGFTDHDIANTLFTTVSLLFLILALKTASQRQLTFSHLLRRDWATVTRPAIYSLLAGVFLGIYLLTWAGALLFVFVIFAYFVIQFIIDHLKGKPSDYLCLVSVITFFIAAIILLPTSPGRERTTSMVIAILIPLVLNGISRVMTNRKMRPAYYPLSLVGLGLAGLSLFHLVNPSLVRSMFSMFTIFIPRGVELTTIEMQPLISFRYPNPLFLAWGNFTTGFFFSFISLVILIYLIIKQGNAGKSLLVVWSLLILLASLGQRRFASYLAVNVALLTGYLSWQILGLAGFKEVTDKVAEAREKIGHYLESPGKQDYYGVLGVSRSATNKEIKQAFQKLAMKYQPDYAHGAEERMKELDKAYEVLSDPRKRVAYDRSEYGVTKIEREKYRIRKGGFRISISQVNMALAVLIVFLIVFAPSFLFPTPNLSPVASSAEARFAPSNAWLSSLSWLRENTPDPFDNPDFYYHLEERGKYRSLYTLKKNIPNPTGDPDFYYQMEQSYKYPESAYGVMAWWDYGYWITRIAHRIPNANPGQTAGAVTKVASFFTSQDEDPANEIVQELGSTYIILDHETAISKFHAVASWAGSSPEEFSELYYYQQQGQLMPVSLFYPEYYRSLAIRLYNFDGKAVTPESTVVIGYQEMADEQGNPYKLVTSAEEFDSYEDAEAYLLSQESANYRIVGVHPFISPVPLEELKHYKLIHGSESSLVVPEVETIPAVKIFEYTGE
ncbi:oligosaccharyl transferase, archaeosortase A system-associated [Chloroflexota bacterium]